MGRTTEDFLGATGIENDDLDLLSERNMDKYRIQRRFIGPIYSAASMKDHERAWDEIINHNVSIMKERAGISVSIDIWMNMFALGKAPNPTSGGTSI